MKQKRSANIFLSQGASKFLKTHRRDEGCVNLFFMSMVYESLVR